jgi:cyclophilin family peptidyl-prolyl cis-trans isomerase
MMMRFFYEDAPSTVANFIELAKSGFYSSKVFHRIEPGYLIQGGCPRGDGTGIRLDGKRIPAEFNGRIMDKGRVAMALLNDDPDSASCQFFICNTRQKDWDGRYTVFGELVGEESFATLERLMNRDVDEQGRPLDPLYMRSVRIIDAPSDALP